MKFVNLTPHEVVVDVDGQRLSLASQGNCRVAVKQILESTLEVDNLRIPFYNNEYGKIEGLPDYQTDIIYVVSLMVINALKAEGVIRHDIVSPDSGPTAIRVDGKIVAVRGFIKN